MTRERIVIVGLTAALVFTLAGFGIAAAVIPASGGVVKACFVTKTGKLRVLDSAAACKKNETAISWNQAGAAGTPGAPGAPGATGIVTTKAFSGPIGTVPIGSIVFSFVGPTASFTTTAGQRLTGSASAVLGAASTVSFDFSLCYSTDGGMTVLPFGGFDYQTANADSLRRPFAAANSVVIGVTGTVIAGFCAHNNSASVPMDRNNYVSGFFQQTN
jgi:hypothetical protein